MYALEQDAGRVAGLTLKYMEAPDVKMLIDEIMDCLDLFYIVPQFVHCYRSKGSKSKRTIARIHGLGKIWQLQASGRIPHYRSQHRKHLI